MAAALEGQLLQRQLAQAVVVAGQPRQFALFALAEDGAHPDPVIALLGQPPLQLAPQLGGRLLGLQHADGLQAGQAVVTAGLGQQRAVITRAQVIQIATEVDDAGATAGGGHTVLQVGAGGQQIVGMAGPVAQLFDDDIGTHIFRLHRKDCLKRQDPQWASMHRQARQWREGKQEVTVPNILPW